MSRDRANTQDRLEAFRGQLASPDLKIRWRALSGLAEMGAPDAVDEIISAIRDGDEMTAAHAANLVQRMHLRVALPIVIDRLAGLGAGANDVNVCLMLYALAAMPDERAIPVLAKFVSHPHGKVRRAAAGALGAIGSPGAFDAIARASEGLSLLPTQTIRLTFRCWARRRR